jgi:DNA-directed RNA polymerase specialized sigma24 family protein
MNEHSEFMPTRLPLTEEEWVEIYNRLLLYTYRKFGYLQNQLKAGIDLDGVVHESILALLADKRRLPEGLDVFIFLCGVIRSKVDAIKKSAEERRRIIIELNDIDTQIEYPSVLVYNNLPGSNHQASDQQVRYNETVHQIRNCIQNDEVLLQYVDELIDSPDNKPNEIARKLNISIRQIQNAQKRLKRLISRIKEALGYE